MSDAPVNQVEYHAGSLLSKRSNSFPDMNSWWSWQSLCCEEALSKQSPSSVSTPRGTPSCRAGGF